MAELPGAGLIGPNLRLLLYLNSVLHHSIKPPINFYSNNLPGQMFMIKQWKVVIDDLLCEGSWNK